MKTSVPTTSVKSSSVHSFSMIVACALLSVATTAPAQSLNFSSSAGYAGQGSADGATSNAQFYLPAGTAIDAAGNVYVADSGNNTIRRITPGGSVLTIAGFPGVAGSTNGLGTNALFNQPQGIAVDAATNLYVTDSGNDTIRKITPAGVVTTFAGIVGVTGSNNATGTNASFNQPIGIAVDAATNLYVADYGNNVVRKISPSGVVTTLAGNATGTNALFYQPEGIAVDPSANVYVTDTANATVRKITPGGAVTTVAGAAGTNGSANGTGINALFYQPLGIGLDSATNLYVADYFNNTIRKITPAGVVTTFAGGPGTNGSQDGLTNRARFWGPNGIAVDGSGNLFVADYFNGTIRKVTSAGVVTTFAGSPSAASVDGSNQVARFNLPVGAAVDTLGNIYVADSANSTIRKITPGGQASTYAGSPGVFGFADGLGTNALFNGPQAVATDNANNVYVADTLNHTIRKITSGAVTTLAGFPGVSGLLDGTGTNAQFFAPQGITVDAAGNIYVSDTLNYTIRKVTPANAVTTLAGTSGTYGGADGIGTNALFNWPKGLALDSATNLYIADYLNHTIRQMTPAGVVTTLAGSSGSYGSADGTNVSAQFFEPSGVAVDSLGNVLVADSGNQTIRKMTPTGTNWAVVTVAGTAGIAGSSNGVGTAAGFDFPTAVALDSSGGVYIADSGNNMLRLDATVFVPLLISNVTVVARRNSAIISWATSAASDSQVAYGLTASYGNLSAYDPTQVTSHSVLLVGLVTNTIYFYEVISTTSGVQTTNTGTFSTDNTIIVQSGQASYTGSTWIPDSGGADRFSTHDKYAATVTTNDSAQATFRPTIVLPAQYDVYYWYSEGVNRSVAAPVTVAFQTGSVVTTLNETLPGGKWQLVASNEPFAAGTNAFLRVGNGTGETGRIVIADAARWTYSPGQDKPVNGNVPAWWASFYFGNNTVNSSSPGANGYSLLNDYILGISPTDPNTFLNFSIKRMTNGFQAMFSPCFAGGRSYQLQGTTNLSANPIVWTNVSNLTFSQTNSLGVFTSTNLSGRQTFYRLNVVLTP